MHTPECVRSVEHGCHLLEPGLVQLVAQDALRKNRLFSPPERYASKLMHACSTCEYAIMSDVTALQFRSDCGNRDTLTIFITQQRGVESHTIKSSTNRT